MRNGTLATLAVGLLLVVGRAPASAQTPQCLNYAPDPRLEAAAGNPAVTQADALVTGKQVLIPPPPGSEGMYRMEVGPWTTFHMFPSHKLACPVRDYHGQPTPGTLGSGVLVGPNLVLTARHLFDPPVECPDVRFVFGFGKFLPGQWEPDCDDTPCTVSIPPEDVYSCQSVKKGPSGEDWAVVTLDRNVQGRTPLPILRQPPFPPTSTPVTVVGHPNRIPMKVEQVNVIALCASCINAHVINGNSGSMVVDEASGKVLGTISGPHGVLLRGCEDTTDPPCYREWFGNPDAWAFVTPAWQAADYIP